MTVNQPIAYPSSQSRSPRQLIIQTLAPQSVTYSASAMQSEVNQWACQSGTRLKWSLPVLQMRLTM